MNTKEKKPIYKKVWFWVLAVIIVGAVGAGMGGTKNQANETTKSTNNSTSQSQPEQKTSENKARLTLDDGWKIDKSNQYLTKVVGTVSNNSNQAINGYIQITFSGLDASGANVGDCLANANTVDANGKWKFEAMCSGQNIETVRFKEITGF